MQHPLHICTQPEYADYVAQCKYALSTDSYAVFCLQFVSTLICMIVHKQNLGVLSSKQIEPKNFAIESEACAGVCHMARVLYLLLAEPDVLFHTSLLLSNLLLVFYQVLRHLPKLRLQSPPDKSHKVIGSALYLLQLTQLKAQLMYSLMIMVCGNLQQKHLRCTSQTSLSSTIRHARP